MLKTCCAAPSHESNEEEIISRDDVDPELHGVKYDPRLFTPIMIGSVHCANRVFMAPLTRLRAGREDGIPTPMMVTYYQQRASAGLIIAEACGISQGVAGYQGSPGIYTAHQVMAWKKITEAVHEKGGKICLQLWHTGRINHPIVLGKGNSAPLSASATKVDGLRTTVLNETTNLPERVDCPKSEAMSINQVRQAVQDYAAATLNAKEAGFDFVEIHAAHGYLLHQFYCANSNLRTDEYGGSLANRCRIILEVLDACIAAWSNDRVGIRISPLDEWQGCDNGPRHEAEPNALYLIKEIATREPAFIHLSEGFGSPATYPPWDASFRRDIRAAFRQTLICNGAYDKTKVKNVLDYNYADAIAFGRRFIQNPDLPRRLEIGAPLNPPKSLGVYGGGEVG